MMPGNLYQRITQEKGCSSDHHWVNVAPPRGKLHREKGNIGVVGGWTRKSIHSGEYMRLFD